MSEQLAVDDQSQSHYEVSLTAGQAFVAFVLLLLSLAATFAFGLMIGKGQADERLVVRKEPTVINEAAVIPKKRDGKIVELGVSSDDFAAAKSTHAATSSAPPATIAESGSASNEPPNTEVPANAAAPASRTGIPVPAASAHPVVSATPSARPALAGAPHPATPAVTGPAYAQLLSTADQKTAETMAARVIDSGFTSTYVDRGSNEKGPVFRVRVKFSSEAEARAAETKLREFSKDVWITH